VDTIFSFKETCEGIDGTAVSPTDAEGILETLTQPSSNQNSFIVWGGSLKAPQFISFFHFYSWSNINYFKFFRSPWIVPIYLFSAPECNNLKEAQVQL
jgi:hypothetical protein